MTRTAEEWGKVAVGLPGWRWTMPWASLPDKHGRVWRRHWCRKDSGFGWTQVCGPLRRDRRPSFDAIDPDDPATAGCLLALLGRPVEIKMYNSITVKRYPRVGCLLSEGVAGYAPTLGRACIAAAEALGRWPGGEG